MSNLTIVDLTGVEDEEGLLEISSTPPVRFAPLTDRTRPRTINYQHGLRAGTAYALSNRRRSPAHYFLGTSSQTERRSDQGISNESRSALNRKRRFRSDAEDESQAKRIHTVSPVQEKMTELEPNDGRLAINLQSAPSSIREKTNVMKTREQSLQDIGPIERNKSSKDIQKQAPDLSILADPQIINLLYDDDHSDDDTEPAITQHHFTDNDEDRLTESSDAYEELADDLSHLDVEEIHEVHPTEDLCIPMSCHVGTFNGSKYTCAAGNCVELSDGSFLRIQALYYRIDSHLYIAGDRLVRQNTFSPMMPRREEELVWTQELGSVKDTHYNSHGLYEVRINEVVTNRVVIFTNQIHRQPSDEDDAHYLWDTERQELVTLLFCRWKKVTIFGPSRRMEEDIIRHLCFEEADNTTVQTLYSGRISASIRDEHNRSQWRNQAPTPGGSHSEVRESFDLVDSRETTQIVRSYTFGDAFCGASGTSQGALDAGLRVRWGFDIDHDAITSYRGNFGPGGTDCREEAVHTFVEEARGGRFVVDVLHISPPCQPFSPANTTPNIQKNEINTAAMFSVSELVKTVRPRVVTVEETFGLLQRYREWFDALIEMLTEQNYSVRWKIIRCQHYGVPQTRRRLFLIASGPGETLPPFAKPTHSDDGRSAKPLVTIADVLRNMRCGTLEHDIDAAKFKYGVVKKPLNFNGPAKTVTCNVGEGNYYPDGTRRYTSREAARLQTFPFTYTFDGANGVTSRRKQIGNAVPPSVAKAMFREIIKSLKESDGIQ